jgi:hypothetical protein
MRVERVHILGDEIMVIDLFQESFKIHSIIDNCALLKSATLL